MSEVLWDTVIVGGGAAGPRAGFVPARARFAAPVVGGGQPGNGPADHPHGYLTRDGVPGLGAADSPGATHVSEIWAGGNEVNPGAHVVAAIGMTGRLHEREPAAAVSPGGGLDAGGAI
ncbi:hypothetical protein [Nonomuraea sp. NPDC003804]|uniref:hypothetical protein n=1 Tax=Nonomuraea sp. NPDC003804 TaxID=3154547 RepID=UPI0033B21E92